MPNKLKEIDKEKEKDKNKNLEKQQKKSDTSLTVHSPDGSHYTSSMALMHLSRYSFMEAYTQYIMDTIKARQQIKVYVTVDEEQIDVTPKDIYDAVFLDKFKAIKDSIYTIDDRAGFSMNKSMSMTSMRSTRVGLGGTKLSMDDILQGVGSVCFHLAATPSEGSFLTNAFELMERYTKPYIRINLRKSECMVLFEQRSCTVVRDSREGKLAETHNKEYDYLTIGKGKVRRRSEAEAQTDVVLCKSRVTNTYTIDTATVGTYVSYFEMFDTYKNLDEPTEISTTNQPGTISTHTDALDQITAIAKLPSFQLSSMIIRRLLAGNEHEEGQRRFRNMVMPDKSSMDVKYNYLARVLFAYEPLRLDQERKAVCDISFCCNNGDIVAVAYGIYSFSAMHVPNSGYVCVWNIKNPGDPERCYFYSVPVVSVEFSPYLQSLLAVGLYDGRVEVRDITNYNNPPLAVSQRSTSSGCEPVMAIKWIKQSETGEPSEIDPFLTLSQDGTVTKFRIINSPYLLGFTQMILERVEGMPEGLPVKDYGNVETHANRQPQGMNLTKHPLYPDIYYLLTDEGCLHKCSTNYPHQYLEVMKTHEGSVNTMDFSPWSPKLFLTCGNDWCIRIWVEGIFKPLLTLKERYAPVYCAYWSRTHSTVIVSLNRKSFNIWDIKRNTLKPMSTNKLHSSYNTLAKWARCGRSIGVGNERGNLLMTAIDNMPFPPHFQYDELEKAIFNAIATYPDLIFELKSIGFFGYPNKGYVNPNS